MKKHFGTKNVKKWIDSNDWEKHFVGFDNLTDIEKQEIKKAVTQASGCLFVRIWEEVSKLFLDYLKKSKSSPYNFFLYFCKERIPKR